MVYVRMNEQAQYTDVRGVRRIARKGEVVIIEVRGELKRLQKEGLAKEVDITTLRRDHNGFLTEDDEAPKVSQEDAKKVSSRPTGGKATKGDIVRAKVDGTELTGEIKNIYKSGEYKIAFENDSEKFRRIPADQVEVLG